VSNLPAAITAGELADLFDQFGLVLGAKIDRWHDRPGGSKGMVDLCPDTLADKAIAALNGTLLGTNKITVRRAPKQTRPAKPAAARPAPAAMPRGSDVSAPARTPLPSYAGPGSYTAVASTRKVVVEYRAPARRIVIPPRRPIVAVD